MGLTTSYVWQGRRQSEVSAMIRHEARSVEEQQGVKRRHANPLIDAARTGENRVLVNDGQGGFKLADSVEEISEAFERRLAQRKAGKGRSSPRKIRSDSNTAALFVLQLDPEFTGPCEGMSPEKRAEVERLHQVMIDQVVERMGQQNVISVSHHWDETNPHVHIICTAMTPDDRVAYYQAVGNDGKRSDWAAHHDAMREALRDSGYDATFERVGQGRKGETLTMYKRQMDQQRAAEAKIDQEWIAFDNQTGMFESWKAESDYDLAARSNKLEDRSKELENLRKLLDARERALGDREAEVERDRREVDEMKAQVSSAMSDASKELETARLEASQVLQEAQQAAGTAVDEAVAAWERDELPRLRRKAVEDAEADADSIKQDAEAHALETVDAAEQEAERLRQQTRAECERLRREAQESRDQADADAAQTRADAERVRDAARQQGWQAGFDKGREVIDEIAAEYENDLIADRFKDQYQSVNFKMRKRQQSEMQRQQQQWKPDFQLGQ